VNKHRVACWRGGCGSGVGGAASYAVKLSRYSVLRPILSPPIHSATIETCNAVKSDRPLLLFDLYTDIARVHRSVKDVKGFWVQRR
jgi:hypothetical protein